MERKAPEPSQGLPRAMSSRDGLLLDEDEEEGMSTSLGVQLTPTICHDFLIAMPNYQEEATLGKGCLGLQV